MQTRVDNTSVDSNPSTDKKNLSLAELGASYIARNFIAVPVLGHSALPFLSAKTLHTWIPVPRWEGSAGALLDKRPMRTIIISTSAFLSHNVQRGTQVTFIHVGLRKLGTRILLPPALLSKQQDSPQLPQWIVNPFRTTQAHQTRSVLFT